MPVEKMPLFAMCICWQTTVRSYLSWDLTEAFELASFAPRTSRFALSDLEDHRGSLHGLIKDSLEWSMVASQPAAGIARALIRGNNDFHLKQSPTSRLQMADSRHPACEKMTRTTRGLYCTANTGLLVSQCAAHSSTPRPTAEMMMQTRVTTKW